MKIIAHRSGPSVYPEQTITSAKFARYCGADMVEIDVRFTKDKKIAICHDENALRVFGVDKKVSDMTSEEYLSLRHKTNKGFCSHLLEDFLECEVAPLLIHIKENQLILDLLELLKKYNYLDKIVLGVLDTSIIKTIKDFDKNVKILAFMPSPDHIEEFAKSGVDYIRLWEHWVNDQTVSKVKSFPVELWIMTNTVSNGINNVGETTPENLEKLLDIGVQGILINDIGILQEVLERR